MKYLGFKDLLNLCESLASSQGFYSRLYRNLLELEEEEKEKIDNVLKGKQFTNDLDLIFWLEC